MANSLLDKVGVNDARLSPPPSVPKVFEELMDSNYWKELNNRQLSQWLMVVSSAINFPSDTLEEIIERDELDDNLIVPCKTIGAVFEEREENEDFDEDESTYLAIFGEKECGLRKQKQLTRSSLLDLAAWCLTQLQEDKLVKSVNSGQEVMRGRGVGSIMQTSVPQVMRGQGVV